MSKLRLSRALRQWFGWLSPYLLAASAVLWVLLFAANANAATFTFAGAVGGANYPTCSGGSWSSSGTTRTCSGSVTLASGDQILPAASRTIVAQAGITLAGSNTVGSSSVNVNLQTNWGNVTANGSSNAIYGDVTSSSGAINLTNATVTGNVTTSGSVTLNGGSVSGNVSGTNGVTTSNGTTIGGNVSAGSGSISLAGGSVAGSVQSSCCTITTSNTNVGNGISSSSNTVSITGGVIAGTISSSGGSGIVISNATISSGSLSASGVPISISGSTVGTASTPVNIVGNNTVSLTGNTTVFGNVTAGSWSGALSIAAGSQVTGTCSPTHARCGSTLSLMAAYRMDEAGWSGSAGEVADNSGNGYHARASNNATTANVTPALATNPGTCSYGVFHSGSAITAGYVQTPLPNLTTNFTITAWIRTTDNTRSGQRILIDDQSNGSGYGFSLGDDGARHLRFFSRAINPVIFDSNYVIANNTWYFVAAVADITNRRRTIYVYDVAGNLLSSATEPAWSSGTWGTDSGPVSIGGETNASGEAPAGFHFYGNLDEVQVYQSALPQSALTGLAQQTHSCSGAGLHHLEIEHSGSGVTCAPSTLTINACADAACTSLYTGGVSGTMTASGTPALTWTGGTGFSISAGGSSTTKSVQAGSAGSVTFGISAPSPSPASSTTCSDGSTASCVHDFADAGFIVAGSANGAATNIAPQTAGTTSATYYLRAVKTSTTTRACEAALTGTSSVNVGYECTDPGTCYASNLLSVNGGSATTVARNNSGSVSSYSAVNMTFDANGNAPFTLNYGDVGAIRLWANKAVSGVTLSGSSNSFVVKPYSFGFSNIRRTSDSVANPAAANASGAAFIGAGRAFTATITALAQGGATTPSFGAGSNSGSETVTLSYALQAPTGVCAGVNCPAVLSGSGASSALYRSAFSNGSATVTDLAWNEVGIITLTATNATFLGNSLTTSGSSGNVGRFIPAYFTTAVTPACSSFTYSGQPFTTAITAKNLAGATTQNYAGASWARTVTLSDATASASGSLSGNSVGASNFSLGTYAAPTPVFTFSNKATAPTVITLRATDTDGVSSSGGASGSEGITTIYSGRLRLANANGSELLALPIPAFIEYYASAAQAWQINSADTSCTVITPAHFAFSFPVHGSNHLAACRTALTVSGTAPTPIVTLAKPGSGYNGWADLTLNLGATPAGSACTSSNAGTGFSGAATTPAYPWLQYPWRSATATNPTSRARFGAPKSGPTIHQRELY